MANSDSRSEGFATRLAWSALIVALFLGLAILFLRVTGFRYEVVMEVANSGQGESEKPLALSRAQRALGIGDDTGSFVSPFNIYLQGLKSRGAAAVIHQDKELLRALFPNRWDPKSEQWIRPDDGFSRFKSFVARLVNFPEGSSPEPGVVSVFAFLEKAVRVQEDEFGKYKISIIIRDRDAGIRLLRLLHETSDNNTRRFVQRISEQSREALEAQLEVEKRTAIRDSLIRAMASNLLTKTMAENANFAAVVFQEPVSTNVPTKPDPVFVLGLAIIAGVFISILLSLMRFYVTSAPQPAPERES